MKNLDSRNIIEFRLRKNLLGPGSEEWTLVGNEHYLTPSEEIISQKPVSRYFTGILFPQIKSITTINQQDTNSNIQTITEDDGSFGDKLPPNINDEDETYIHNHYHSKSITNESESLDNVTLPSAYMPSSMGMSFAVTNSTKYLSINITYGKYEWVPWRERKMPISEIEQEILLQQDVWETRPVFFSHFRIHDNYLLFDQESTENAPYITPSSRNEEQENKENNPRFQLIQWRIKLKDLNIEKNILIDFLNKLERLIGRDVYKRNEINKTLNIDIRNYEINLPIENDITELKVKTKNYNNNILVRIALINKQIFENNQTHFTLGHPEISLKSIFQTKLTATLLNGEKLVPYKNNKNAKNKEEAEINLQYRELQAYGVGHNTSVVWNDDKTEVMSEWLPTTPVIPTSSKDISESSNEVLNLQNTMSCGVMSNEQLLNKLEEFVHTYERWIETEHEKKHQINHEDIEAAERILEKQIICKNRLFKGINILRNNENALKCFRSAMLAMRIQMVLSRHPAFGNKKKTVEEANRDLPNTPMSYFYNNILTDNKSDIFETYLRPFQLAFILLCIEGIVNIDSIERKTNVDLIWFPTGGGKTEAYLGLTAFCILWRRHTNNSKNYGTAVVMRYTLRLLTAQQFERASRLVCALEYMRQHSYNDILGQKEITIGLFVGQESTPNSNKECIKVVEEIEQRGSRANKFQIHHCPWCGCETDKEGNSAFEFRKKKEKLNIRCRNEKCIYGYKSQNESLPITLIDEQIYHEPPTVLFGTVDKFAQIIHKPDAHRLFGKGKANSLPPDLIIQDELHLISGPLGSSVGLFEAVFEELCKRDDGSTPKIIASTATTRNTNNQIKAIYGKNREAMIFPPAGIDESDSFFSKKDYTKDNLRQYFGILPTGRTTSSLQSNIIAQLVLSRVDMLHSYLLTKKSIEKTVQIDAIKELNKYWTILSYYNSLREVGIAETKIGEEIKAIINMLFERIPAHKKQFSKLETDFFRMTYKGFSNRTKELTSRIASKDIKSAMDSLEYPLEFDLTGQESNNTAYNVKGVVDIALATNMISVGLDVSRLNLMVINGQPRSVSEYIQATSRVARKDPGLVVVINNPYKARERSLYEHFQDFHQAIYKQVEPLSSTPATEAMLEQLLPSLFVAYARNNDNKRLGNKEANEFPQEYGDKLLNLLQNRYDLEESQVDFCKTKINSFAEYWNKMYENNNSIKLNDSELLKPAIRTFNSDEEHSEDNNPLIVVQSLRNVSPQAYIKLNPYHSASHSTTLSTLKEDE